MQPMIRPNTPAAPPAKRVTIITVIAILTIVLGALAFYVFNLVTAMIFWISAALLLLIQSISIQVQAINQRLEILTKEMSAMRQLLAITVVRGNPGAKGEHEPEQRKATSEGASTHRGPVPQPAGD
jgi:cobalamin biosynthesis protein CobD/CbiB